MPSETGLLSKKRHFARTLATPQSKSSKKSQTRLEAGINAGDEPEVAMDIPALTAMVTVVT
jgi:hypothetical protein